MLINVPECIKKHKNNARLLSPPVHGDRASQILIIWKTEINKE